MPFALLFARNRYSITFSLRTSAKLVLDAVFSFELLYAPGRVHQLLFAGIERVALRANIDMNVLRRGTCLNDAPAGAGDSR